MNEKISEGVWRLADPKISITSLAALIVGGSVAARDEPVAWTWHAVMLLALFCMEVAKNAWGDVIDYDSGTDLAVQPEDRTNFSGGKRVMVDGLLSRHQTWAVAAGFGLAGCVLGAVVVVFREEAALWIGLVGLVLGWSYHGPPLKLVYRGLGELDVVLCYGPLIVLATYLVQTHQYSLDAFWLSVPLGILIAAFLWVNEFPDYKADAGAGKKNMVVRLGQPAAARALPLIYLMAYGLLAAIPFFTGVTPLVWIGFIAAPFSLMACIWTLREPESFYRSKPVQPFALLSFVAYSLGVGAGLFLGW